MIDGTAEIAAQQGDGDRSSTQRGNHSDPIGSEVGLAMIGMGDFVMRKRVLWSAMGLLIGGFVLSSAAPQVEAAPPGQPTNWGRFYHYPYVYYPHNMQAPVTYDHMYYRYPAQRQIPVYNKDWHNFYPGKHPYHKGFHNTLDVF